MAAFTIRGKNVEVTPALRDYVEKRVGKITKYFENIGKLERQIRKQKTKLERRFRHGGFKAEAVETFAQAVPEEDDIYPIVKTKRFALQPMDAQEAIMQMNLLNHHFFVFRNAETGEVNVVYGRHDGKYASIEVEEG